MDRRGVSPVVATVLLLVLTVVIAGVIFSTVIPFVNDKLGESKACLDVFEGLEFAESRFNCYNYSSSAGDYESGVSIKVKKAGFSSMRLAMIDENENSNVYNIGTEDIYDDARMIGGATGLELEFPGVSGQRTYVIKGRYSQAEISAVTEGGDVCSLADVVELSPCASGVGFP